MGKWPIPIGVDSNSDKRSSPAVYALTGQGLELAGRLCAGFARADLYAPESLRGKSGIHQEAHWFRRLGEVLESGFHAYGCHIFIAATGIAVRAIAPHLRGKEHDPAVLALDQRGRFVISLLSGHIGGANAMARRIAGHIGALPVITTATDIKGLPALDQLAVERGLAIADLGAAKAVSAALLAGERVRLCDPENRLGISGGAWEPLFLPPEAPAAPAASRADAFAPARAEAAVIVTAASPPAGEGPGSRRLFLHPRVLCAGIGCRRGASARDILAAIERALAEAGLAAAALASLASIEAKQDESGLREAARLLGLPLYCYCAERLAAYPVRRPSAKAREMFGIDGVCEPAALAGAGEISPGFPRLLREKSVIRGVTVAVAAAVRAEPA